ncbi:MAG TPA: hypothetical protein VGY77_10140 [Gemmataceae bacterium]|nr:hypothetical protein [Gemmataceae bacterium]
MKNASGEWFFPKLQRDGRDPVMARQPVKEKGRVTGVQEYEADPGETDKRLLIVEPEYAVVLRNIERQGNTLSAILRNAWDGLPLRSLTTGRQHSPVQATNPHISLIGHITQDELRRYLSRTEAASGYGNRHLWLCVRRSKCLPEGGGWLDLDRFIGPMSGAIAGAREGGELRRDDRARAVWKDVYPSLSDGKPGLAGAMLGRGEAQVMRLASLYALMDLSRTIKADHLVAALALWSFCERSIKYIFGDSLGDDVADEILVNLRRRKDGVTRTEIRDIFGRNQSGERIARALSLLTKYNLAECRPDTDTGGRPAERWFYCGRTT